MKIINRKQCKKVIEIEKEIRKKTITGNKRINWITREDESVLERYQKLMRLDEYYSNTATGLKKFLQLWYRYRKNRLGERLGITIGKNVFDEGLLIWHYGYIVVNGMAKIGKNCSLHGNNCIGNDGIHPEAPVIGDNVDIGAGASIIGNVRIANDVRVGAGAVVVHSINTPGVTVVGVPAKVVRKG